MFTATDKDTAEKYLCSSIQKDAEIAPKLSAWMEENLAEGFTATGTLAKDPNHHSLERINKKIRRRTRVE